LPVDQLERLDPHRLSLELEEVAGDLRAVGALQEVSASYTIAYLRERKSCLELFIKIREHRPDTPIVEADVQRRIEGRPLSFHGGRVVYALSPT
jgi:hypothetical protein